MIAYMYFVVLDFIILGRINWNPNLRKLYSWALIQV